MIEFLKKIAFFKTIREIYVGTEKDNEHAIKLYKTTGEKLNRSHGLRTKLINLGKTGL